MNLSEIKPSNPDWFDDFTRGWLHFFRENEYHLRYYTSSDSLQYRGVRSEFWHDFNEIRNMYIDHGRQRPFNPARPDLIEILP